MWLRKAHGFDVLHHRIMDSNMSSHIVANLIAVCRTERRLAFSKYLAKNLFAQFYRNYYLQTNFDRRTYPVIGNEYSSCAGTNAVGQLQREQRNTSNVLPVTMHEQTRLKRE
jgi:hypothetical protein